MNAFVQAWQHLPENIDPVFLKLGSFEIRYYGLMWVAAIVVTYLIVLWRIKNECPEYKKETIDDYFSWAILGALLGGRLGYVLFYNLSYFISHPLEIFLPMQMTETGLAVTGISGMSYHGGLIGVALVTLWFCRKAKLSLWPFVDLIVSAVPLGYTLGRIGNFLNGELFGRVTQQWFGMYFPYAPTYELRHPSQLYEAFGEGILLFILIWSIRKHKAFQGQLLSVYLFGYGLARFVIEFVRAPDAHLGLLQLHLSMGQWLCVGMMAIAILMYIFKPVRL